MDNLKPVSYGFSRKLNFRSLLQYSGPNPPHQLHQSPNRSTNHPTSSMGPYSGLYPATNMLKPNCHHPCKRTPFQEAAPLLRSISATNNLKPVTYSLAPDFNPAPYSALLLATNSLKPNCHRPGKRSQFQEAAPLLRSLDGNQQTETRGYEPASNHQSGPLLRSLDGNEQPETKLPSSRQAIPISGGYSSTPVYFGNQQPETGYV